MQHYPGYFRGAIGSSLSFFFFFPLLKKKKEVQPCYASAYASLYRNVWTVIAVFQEETCSGFVSFISQKF